MAAYVGFAKLQSILATFIMFSFKHLLSPDQVTKADVEKVFELADRFAETADHGSNKELDGKVLGALFFEPSTRTRLSTETAMLRQGGSVINVIGMESSSLKKGESLQDTARMVSNFADIIAMRHPDVGSVEEFAKGSLVPVINCGDGAGDHPTQALLDMYTIYKKYGRLDGLKIALVGDLKFGRTVHSLIKLLAFYQVELILISPEALKMPEKYEEWLKEKGVNYKVVSDLEANLQDVDVGYITRVQQERFDDQAEYMRLKDSYIINRALMERVAPNSMLMHPLPRLDEIAVDCDDWEGAYYFKQVKNGVAVRMAIIFGLLNS